MKEIGKAERVASGCPTIYAFEKTTAGVSEELRGRQKAALLGLIRSL